MKGLLKYLSPFAPDQSGAVSVLFELGGITVICDAGGCTGNICGFDEPRWFYGQSAIFSAGLRDMDAILGRDDRLVAKLKSAAEKLDCSFAALIGTPVPAVIATDFKALTHMAEKRCGLPVIAVECLGTRLYDEGASDAYLALFQKFTKEPGIEKKKILGVLGATPLDMSHIRAGEIIRKQYEASYDQVWVFGMGAGLSEIAQAGLAEKNLVVAPSGLAAAKYLKERFGTDYEIAYPMLRPEFREQLHTLQGKKVLIIHQQIAANEIRNEIAKSGDCDVTVASFFMMKPSLKQPQDVKINREEQLCSLVAEGKYDVVIGDGLLKRAFPDYNGTFLHLPHFAVSGEYEDELW